MYRKLINPIEEEVSELLKEGYNLHSVTPIKKPYTQTHSDLVYHFIKEVVVNINPQIIGIDWTQEENPFKPRESN